MKNILILFITVILTSFDSISENTAVDSVTRNAVTSFSRRFVVQGGLSGQNLELALWADDILEKIERLTEMPVPFIKGHKLNIVLKENVEKGAERVIRRQHFEEGKLYQLIEVKGYQVADQEDLLEAITGLLLNRYVVIEQGYEKRREEIGRVPDWFSVGMAQVLFPELRARNYVLVHQAWSNGILPQLTDYLTEEYLPRGRWVNKAMAGLVFEWLQGSSLEMPYKQLFRHWGKGKSLGFTELSRIFPGLKNETDFLKTWDVWMASRIDGEKRQQIGEDNFYNLYTEIQTLSPGFKLTSSFPGIPEHIRLHKLHEYRDQEWYSSVLFKYRLMQKKPVNTSLEEGRALQRSFTNYLTSCAYLSVKKKLKKSKIKEAKQLSAELLMAYQNYIKAYEAQQRYFATFEKNKAKAEAEISSEKLEVESADRAYLNQFEGN